MLRLLILLIACSTLTGCGGCGSNADSIALAKSLSQPRLAQLYQDAVALDLTHSGNARLFKDGKSGIPPNFNDLEPQSVVSDGLTARIHMAGCVDDKVMLFVNGLDGKSGKEITLVPGEAQDSVILWQVK
ncbi:hypothetical protein [Pseudoxanthomonas sacheonensis]|uniref:Lipoprotein n=1 Tax=Pseudoxanthomonas sacheonensis TaxID=443615 RepID=A0ABU1RRW2_9GAMM|nr:hypothetical protein [Pseudoxanthomonas sacheonensis]MDR6841509.1 hypothetical protein [Pseudoxanthomonas sacheonensis]